MAIKVYSPTDFEDTSSGVSIDGNLVVDTSVLYVDTANNRVGIGTTSPHLKLHLAHSDSNNGLLLEHTSQASSYSILQNIRQNEGLIWQRWINGFFNSNLITLSYDGDLGIGTTSPDQKLQIHESTSSGAYLKVTNSTTGEDGGNGSLFGISSNEEALVWNYENTATRFGTNGTERMRITSSGNVGIGTVSPEANLHVVGNDTGILELTRNSGTPHIFFKNTSNTGYGRIYVSDNAFQISAGTSTKALDFAWIQGDSNGNVGIGTTNPVYKLAVQGSANNGIILYGVGTTAPRGAIAMDASNHGYLEARTSSGGQNIMLRSSGVSWINGGNVGIGTVSPSYKLSVAGTSHTYNIHPAGAGIDLYSTGNIAPHYQTSVDWYTGVPGSGTHRMKLDSSGNLGIGTTNPTAKLQVTGAGYFLGESLSAGLDQTYTNVAILIDEGDYIYTKDSSATLRKLIGKASDIIYIGQGGTSLIDGINLFSGQSGYVSIQNTADGEMARFTGGKLGIGTTSPSYKLDVDGEARVTNGIRNNTYVEHVTNDLSGAGNANTNRHQYQFMELAYNTFHWSNGSPIIIEVMQTDFTGSEYAKYMLNWNYLDGGGTNEFILKVLENTSVNGNSNNHRVIIGTPYDTGVNDGGYDLYALPLLLEAWYYCDYVVKVSFANVGMTRISTGTNFSVRAQYKFWDAPSATVIAGTPSSTEILPSPNNHAFYGTLYGDGRLFNQSTSNNIGNITNYFVDPANTITAAHLAGNVGIGTTSPSQKLDVSGNIKLSGYIVDSNNEIIDFAVNDLKVQGKHINAEFGVWARSYGATRQMGIDGSASYMGLYTSGTEKMRITSGGNVLIGTTTDSGAKLEVAGSVGNFKTTGHQIFLTRNGNNEIYAVGASSVLALGTNSAEKMRIDASGNVGIGTTNPETRLDIQGNGDAVQIRRSNGYASIKAHSDNGGNLILDSHSTSGAIFLNNYVNRPVYIATGGANVGVGNTDPDHKLDVTGDIRARGASPSLYLRDTSVSGLQHRIVGGGNAGLEYHADTTNVGAGYHRWDIGGGSSLMYLNESGNLGIGTTSPSAKLEVNGDGTNTGGITLRHSTNQVHYIYTQSNYQLNRIGSSSPIWRWGQEGGSDKMTLNNTGLGIGTTSPAQKLHVVGNIRIDDGYTLSWGADTTKIAGNSSNNTLSLKTNSADRLYINSSGNVGIGTSSPVSLLHISSANSNTTSTITNTAASGYSRLALINAERSLLITNNAADDKLSFSYDNANRLQFNLTNQWFNSGNVGIGTTSPQRPLDVNGDIQNNGVLRRAGLVFLKSDGVSTKIGPANATAGDVSIHSSGTLGTGDQLAVFKSSGNVGIGTTSPTAKLSVNGAIQAGGKYSYRKGYASLDTTGAVVAGLNTSFNGASAMFKFEMHGGLGHYQKVVYSCHNAGGNWFATKVIDEGTNELDVEASANNSTTITFTFKARNSTQPYSPAVEIEASGSATNTTYL